MTRSLKFRVLGPIVAVAALGLCSCSNDKTEAVASDNNKGASSRAGPHGAYDPHAKLGPDKLAQVALKHRAEGRYALAIQTLDQAISQYSNNANLHGVRGSILLEQGKTTAALKDLETSISLDKSNPVTLTNRAQAYRQFGRIKESLNDLNQAIKLDSNMLAARFNRGAIYYSSGDFKKALVDFDQCVAIDPHAPAPYFNRAAVNDALGKHKDAIKDLDRFIELADNEAWKKTARELKKKWSASNKKTKS